MNWDEARTIAHGSAGTLTPTEVPLNAAAGRPLAKPLVARNALPAFDTCAMDGYAVAGAGPWRIGGQALAGQPPTRLRPGMACEVGTGAAVPDGCTGLLPHEAAEVDGERLAGSVRAGQHLRRAGDECAAGEQLLPAGTSLTPAALGLAAATGHDTLRVIPPPRVRLVITGTELLLSGPPTPGHIRDALGPLLPPLLAPYGVTLAPPMHCADDPAATDLAVADAGEQVLLTTGASSHGPADLLRGALARLGARLLIDGVRVRPGHPMLLAVLPDGRLVIGLPGNPFAAVAAVVTLLAPVLAGLGGQRLPELGTCGGNDLRGHPADTRLIPVKIFEGYATPTGADGPAMLRGLAQAHALAVVPPGADPAPGRTVRLLPLT